MHPASGDADARRYVRADQWLRTRVAGFPDKHAADADGKIIGPGAGLADMHELIGETGACLHFQEKLPATQRVAGGLPPLPAEPPSCPARRAYPARSAPSRRLARI